jgi:protein O-GlcNAc transferase
MKYKKKAQVRPAALTPLQWETLAREKAQQGDPAAAVSLCQQALAAWPGNRELYSQLLFYLMGSPDLTAPEVFDWFKQASDYYPPELKTLKPLQNSPEPWRRLKVAYVSGDFRHHALARVCSPLFESHDPRLFETYIYSNTAQTDDMSQWFREHSDHWREIHGQSSARVIQQIQADGIDILVDLAGHTSGCRLDLFSQRVAPVQITAGLGILASTGLDTVDYRLADRALVPEALAAFNSEEVVWLSHHLNWNPPEVLLQLPLQPPPCLKNGYITFGSANRTYKLNALVLDIWASLLRALPDSRLMLKCNQLDQPAQRKRLHQAFGERGIAPERVSFSGQTSTPEHIAWQSQIDIALDPFPYQGGLTTLEALFMGVPVVALNYPGGSRGALSILNAIGQPDWIAQDPRAYFEIALKLARNPDELLRLRQSLRQNMLSSPIFQGLDYTRQIENALRWLWLRWCRQEAPVPGQASAPPPDCHPHDELPPPEPAYLDRLKTQAAHFFELEHFSRSEALCREVLFQDPKDHATLHLLGLLAFRFGDIQAGESLIRQAIALSPEQGFYHYNLGNILASADRQPEARQAWHQAVTFEPSLAAYLQTKGS